MKRIFDLILVLSILLVSLPAAQASQQAQNSLDILNASYKDFLSSTESDPTYNGDVAQACIMTVFREWASSYMTILDRTTGLSPRDVGVPLMLFGRLFYDSTRGMKMYDYFRPGLSGAIKAELDDLRASMGVPLLGASSQLSLRDVQQASLLSTMALCDDPVSLDRMAAGAGELDLSLPFPLDIANSNKDQVTWIESESGGIKLVLRPPTTPAPDTLGRVVTSFAILLPATGSGTTAASAQETMGIPNLDSHMTYEKFVKRVRSGQIF